MKENTRSTIFFIAFIIIIVTAAIYNTYATKEGYENFNYVLGEYPASIGRILPKSMFPYTSANSTSTCTPSMIWRNYPIFEVGSYKQETNNIRKPRNPDQGRCTPADFCGALYNNRNVPNNIVTPLPPVNENTPGPRINYYKADTENMLPYYNKGNILY